MNICIFEDFFIFRLHPINHLRHTSEIICGASSVKDKIIKYFKPKSLTLYSRDYLAPYLREKYPEYKINQLPTGECIFLNSRVVFSKRIARKILKSRKSSLWVKNDTLAAIVAKRDVMFKVNNIFSSRATLTNDFKSLNINIFEAGNDVKVINYPSDLIQLHKEELDIDITNILKSKKRLTTAGRNLRIAIRFDTKEGKIFIGSGTKIEPFCYIKGPVCIGKNCTIKSGTSIYGPVTIGDSCKVSGEISSSVLHSYVNKQHLGFLGHSYICEWVNLGAGTNTSNLKNNYSNIMLNIGGNKVDTNSIFLGSIIGDHTKTGINTMLNTGTLAGISCNMFGGGFHKKIIKSFSWADASSGNDTVYEYAKALNTARVSMQRRNFKMTEAYEKMFMQVYDSREKFEI